MHDSVLARQPLTNNPVEAWHSALTSDTKSHPSLNAVLEEIRLEQSKTENIIINLDSGDIIPNNKSSKQKKKKVIFITWLLITLLIQLKTF